MLRCLNVGRFLLNEAIATLGENIVIARFIRFAVGENSSSS